MNDRRTGLTTKQMLTAPEDAVYVWVNNVLEYPRILARELGRTDLTIVPVSWLDVRSVAGRTFTGVVLDHAARPSSQQWDVYLKYVLPRIRKS